MPNIVEEIGDAVAKIKKEWYKCPECGAEGHNTHYGYCSRVKTPIERIYLHETAKIDKNKVVKQFHMTHASVDDNFLGQIGKIREIDPDEGFFVSVKKYNNLKSDFEEFKIKYFKLMVFVLFVGAIFGFVLGTILRGGA